jgi:hypothetical protein
VIIFIINIGTTALCGTWPSSELSAILLYSTPHSLQIFTHKILISCHTHSSHFNLGLPTFLVPSGLVLNTFLIILFSLVRIKYPDHLSLFSFMNPIKACSLNTRESKKLSALLFFKFIYTKVRVEQVRHFST